MKQQEIFKKLQGIIMPYLEMPCEIKMESDLSKDLAINSVDFISIVMEIEDAFQCTIDYEQVVDIQMVQDLVQYMVNDCQC